VVRRVHGGTRDGQPRQLRGVDVFRVRDGQIAEMVLWAKG
jgi:ketosteroid isomerase-like protein